MIQQNTDIRTYIDRKGARLQCGPAGAQLKRQEPGERFDAPKKRLYAHEKCITSSERSIFMNTDALEGERES